MCSRPDDVHDEHESRASWSIVLVLLVVLLVSPIVGQVEFIGERFQVNIITTANQLNADVTSTGDGGFFVVWQSGAGTDGDVYSIAGRFLGADGSPVGNEFQVNDYTTGMQQHPEVAADSVGHLVVVWQSAGSAGSDSLRSSLQARRLTSGGAFLGDEFQVNTYTTGDQALAAVGMDTVGGFVVVWNSEGSGGSDTDGRSIQGRRFAAGGYPLGDDFQINTSTLKEQKTPAVAMADNGDFIVVWASYQGQGPGTTQDFDIMGQRFAANGVFVGGEFVVRNSSYEARVPSVAVNDDGDFAVLWEDRYWGLYHFSNTRIEGKSFSADGNPVGGLFVVDTVLYREVLDQPDVMMERGRNFVVTWASQLMYSPIDIQGERFRSDGAELSQFVIESDATAGAFRPALARDDAGRFMVVWADTAGFDIFGRLFAEFFFADGFESGNTSRWSSAVP